MEKTKEINNITYYMGWLRQKDARKYLGNISHQKFKEYVILGLPERIVSGVYLYHPMEIDEFIENQRSK